MKGLPRAMFTLMKVPGIGPKNAYKLVESLKISDRNALDDLAKKAQKGEIAKLPNFGEESQKDILQSIKEYKTKPETRMLISQADQIASAIFGSRDARDEEDVRTFLDKKGP